jgi:sigma-B regulation protein RsbU (phosphoserine phosphatase)
MHDAGEAFQVPSALRRPDRSLARWAEEGGPALGLVEGARYASCAVKLGSGEALLAVTDGITEAAAEAGPRFGDAGVRAWRSAASAPALFDLLAEARAREQGAEPADDVAALLLERAW